MERARSPSSAPLARSALSAAVRKPAPPRSALADRAHEPTDAELAHALGRSHAAWRALVGAVEAACGPIAPQWAFTGAFGWSLRLKHGERVLVYLLPGAGRFTASFALGEKAVAAARDAKLPATILAAIDAAPRYAEGRGVRIEVTGVTLARAAARLVAIKHAH